MKKSKLLIIIGPTAIGKTDLSIKIAQEFKGEIISGDSMQVYKGMDIGTGKITRDETKGIPHHMIDILEPSESFSVADFQEQVASLVKDIESRGKLPIIVGGTGHYIKALIDGYEFNEEDALLIEEKTKEYESYDSSILYEKLLKLDPTNDVHPNNRQRVIRQLVKKTMPKQEKKAYTKENDYVTFVLGLTTDRSVIYERINQRVLKMFESGLEEEVKKLFKNGLSKTASQAIGYKEFLPYLKGEASIDSVVERVQAHSRQYAKRQLTYFRNQLDVNWYDIATSDTDIIYKDIYQFLQTKGEN
jgi:tRNA dimethylallyltransferase